MKAEKVMCGKKAIMIAKIFGKPAVMGPDGRDAVDWHGMDGRAQVVFLGVAVPYRWDLGPALVAAWAPSNRPTRRSERHRD
jgi:hypothetical protein